MSRSALEHKKHTHDLHNPTFGAKQPCCLPPVFRQFQGHQSLHACAEGLLCDWWRDSESFRCPTHHMTVENFGGPAAKSLVFKGQNERPCGQHEANTASKMGYGPKKGLLGVFLK